jgi:hypothetical protein
MAEESGNGMPDVRVCLTIIADTLLTV